MTVAAVLLVLVVHNLGANLWVAERRSHSQGLYVAVNLFTAGIVAVLAGVSLSWGEAPAAAVAAALVVLAAVGTLAVFPATRQAFADQRMAGVDARGTAWQVLVRIPFGTVVLEEVAFRGVLPVLLSPVAASVLFGLWHIVPTIKTLDINGVTTSRGPAVAGAVASTAVVGLVLCWLRSATGGLLAPGLAHAAANGGAVVASYVVLTSAADEVPPPDPLPDVAAEQAEEQAS